mmetsp:Transcript_70832/g.195668  ORF Transcript_70832/g.195668 Transcript_70832/m.195668 type:complete len:218 (-) Transcript_70832:375-1028(-)
MGPSGRLPSPTVAQLTPAWLAPSSCSRRGRRRTAPSWSRRPRASRSTSPAAPSTPRLPGEAPSSTGRTALRPSTWTRTAARSRSTRRSPRTSPGATGGSPSSSSGAAWTSPAAASSRRCGSRAGRRPRGLQGSCRPSGPSSCLRPWGSACSPRRWPGGGAGRGRRGRWRCRGPQNDRWQSRTAFTKTQWSCWWKTAVAAALMTMRQQRAFSLQVSAR